MAKLLISLGVIMIVLGLLWPILTKLGLGNLPGDIHIERKGLHFYFPLTSSLILSGVLTIILWIFRK